MKRSNDLIIKTSDELIEEFSKTNNYVGEYYNIGKKGQLEQANRDIDELLAIVEKKMGLDN